MAAAAATGPGGADFTEVDAAPRSAGKVYDNYGHQQIWCSLCVYYIYIYIYICIYSMFNTMFQQLGTIANQTLRTSTLRTLMLRCCILTFR